MATKKKTRPLNAVQQEKDGFLTRVIDGVETQLTVNGQPIPIMFAHAIPYEKTDQGMAEANEGKDVAHVQVIADAWDNMLAKRGDPSIESWQSPDPMREAVERVKRPGMAYKFLSDPHIQRKGMRGYEFARDADGREVRVGRMILGEMPEEMRNRRNAHYQKLGNDEVTQAEQQYRTDQVRVLRDAGFSESDALRPGEKLRDYDNPDRQATIGVRLNRGEAI